MAGSLSLDDKLVGEKVNNYCSSSEDEGEDKATAKSMLDAPPPAPRGGRKIIKSTNTGPKGVLQDWREYKQLEHEKIEAKERETSAMIKKLAITVKPESEEKCAKEEDVTLTLEDDDFMKEFRQRRMKEMRAALVKAPAYGTVTEETNGEKMLLLVESAPPDTIVIVFVYEKKSKACDLMNECVHEIAGNYPSTHFIRISAKEANFSSQFARDGVPALIVYKSGNLIGNFVTLANDLGEDYCAADVEGFLQSHSILPDEDYTANSIRSAVSLCPDGDSDDE